MPIFGEKTAGIFFRAGQFLKILKTMSKCFIFVFLKSHQYYRDEYSQKHVYSSVTTTINREAS
jgi:hypothetical protein